MGAVLLAGLALTACGGDDAAGQAATRACGTLGEIARDYQDGVTTADELPDELERLVRDARDAEPGEVHDVAVDALAQARSGDATGLAESITRLSEICADV